MALSGSDVRHIQDVFLNAFDRASLEILVRTELNGDLDAIAGPGDLRTVTYHLITWAERSGCLDQLIAGAYRSNPGNHNLQRLYQDLPRLQAAAQRTLPVAPAPAPSYRLTPQPGPAPTRPRSRGGGWITGLLLLAIVAGGAWWLGIIPGPWPPTPTPAPPVAQEARPVAQAPGQDDAQIAPEVVPEVVPAEVPKDQDPAWVVSGWEGCEWQPVANSHQPEPAWCSPGKFLVGFRLAAAGGDGYDEPSVVEANCCALRASVWQDYASCEWREVGTLASHQRDVLTWCPDGSFLVQFDHGGDRSYSPGDQPAVERARCCTTAELTSSTWEQCSWEPVAAAANFQGGGPWCPEGWFITQFDLDGTGGPDVESPVVGAARCCRLAPTTLMR